MARILIIDDDEQILRTLHQVLEMEGHEVLDAPNGKEGMKIYEKRGADLVITDIVMPEKEGIETIKELQEDNPDLKIIAISGGGTVDPRVYLHLAENLGAMRTLVKPFTREQLLTAVSDLLE